jgi:polyisoprenoid-binding protein YceI
METTMTRRRARVAALAVLAAVSMPAAAEPSSWRIEAGEIRVLVPLKPGGAFTATSPSLEGTLTLGVDKPARLTGRVELDLSTIDTGIALRNQHLREKYLEVAKGAGYDRAVLSDIRFHEADGAGFAGRTAFTATLLLHGVTKAIAGTAEVAHEGADRRVKAVFPLELTDFGVVPPMYLGVGVASRLRVTALLVAKPAAPAAP